MTEEEYNAFYEALVSAERVPRATIEPLKLFEGCMPVEEIASRGRPDAHLRADEAGRPGRPAHRAVAVSPSCSFGRRTRTARSGGSSASRRGSSGRAGARLPHDPRPRERRVRPLRRDAPQHLHRIARAPPADDADEAPRRLRMPLDSTPWYGRMESNSIPNISSSPARSPASRATSSPPRRGWSPGSTPRG